MWSIDMFGIRNGKAFPAISDMKLAYLATPYSRYPLGIEQAFIDAAKLAGRLLRIGLCVYSPITHTHPFAVFNNLDPLDYSIWQPFDEAMLNACDALIVAHMDGWQDSLGLAREVAFFERADKPIFDLDTDSLGMTRRQKREASGS